MAEKGLVHIVDDELSIRRSVGFLLNTAGYAVEHWPDGIAFLKAVDRSAPACVLLDIRMPGMDGLEVLTEMTREGVNFPVVILTGHGDVSLAVRAMHAGCVDFLEKPFDRDRLLHAVAVAFRRMEDRAALRERAEWAVTELAKLTGREREVLDGLACGFPNKTIAYDLGISSRTVEVYRANVMVKLGVASFAEALRLAFAAGLGSERKWRELHPAQRSGNVTAGAVVST